MLFCVVSKPVPGPILLVSLRFINCPAKPHEASPLRSAGRLNAFTSVRTLPDIRCVRSAGCAKASTSLRTHTDVRCVRSGGCVIVFTSLPMHPDVRCARSDGCVKVSVWLLRFSEPRGFSPDGCSESVPPDNLPPSESVPPR